jgi:hypothetical protein
MAGNEHTATIVVALAGATAAIISGYLGYQTGTSAVEKDYVSLAISTLDKKESSPELRKWSVDVLSKLSPVPFNSELKKELETAGTRQRMVFKDVQVPDFLKEPCPNILSKIPKEVGDQELRKLAREYEVCRTKYDSFLKYINGLNKITADANSEQLKIDNEFRQKVGLPVETPNPPASANP